MEDEQFGTSPIDLVTRVARIAGPVIVLFLVILLVLGYVGQFRDASEDTGAPADEGARTEMSAEETISAEPTGVPETEPTNGSASGASTVVVLIEGLNMRDSATTDSEVIKRLALDARLTLIGESPGWYQVRDEDGDEGWVAAGGKYTRLE